MRDDETAIHPLFYGGPLDGERVSLIEGERPVALRPVGCLGGFYIFRDSGRYEWRELSDACHG